MTFAAVSEEAVSTTDNAAYDVLDTFTLEAWVKCTGAPPANGYGIITMGLGAAFYRVGSSGGIQILKSGTSNIGTTTTLVNDNVWHHIAWTKSGATNFVYIDAVDRTPTITNVAMVNTLSGMGVACDMGSTPNSVVAGSYMDGLIAEPALYGTALDQTRVSAHFNAATAVGLAPDYFNFPKPKLRRS